MSTVDPMRVIGALKEQIASLAVEVAVQTARAEAAEESLESQNSDKSEDA